MSGAFINFNLTYRSGTHPEGLDNNGQADAILAKAKSLLEAGFPGVGITYSANEDQTIALEAAYAAGTYSANIRGANQAQVMNLMETKLGSDQWSELQLKLRIAPITTIPTRAATNPKTIIQEDLSRIEAYLKDGWAILGWQNQSTVSDTAHPYAVGGGVMKLSADIDDLIQTTLKTFVTDYPES